METEVSTAFSLKVALTDISLFPINIGIAVPEIHGVEAGQYV